MNGHSIAHSRYNITGKIFRVALFNRIFEYTSHTQRPSAQLEWVLALSGRRGGRDLRSGTRGATRLLRSERRILAITAAELATELLIKGKRVSLFGYIWNRLCMAALETASLQY